jgi:hypothetical protein
MMKRVPQVHKFLKSRAFKAKQASAANSRDPLAAILVRSFLIHSFSDNNIKTYSPIIVHYRRLYFSGLNDIVALIALTLLIRVRWKNMQLKALLRQPTSLQTRSCGCAFNKTVPGMLTSACFEVRASCLKYILTFYRFDSIWF